MSIAEKWLKIKQIPAGQGINRRDTMENRLKKAHQRSEDMVGDRGGDSGAGKPSLVLLVGDAAAFAVLALLTIGSTKALDQLAKLIGC